MVWAVNFDVKTLVFTRGLPERIFAISDRLKPRTNFPSNKSHTESLYHNKA